jgi:hypothetical protein
MDERTESYEVVEGIELWLTHVRNKERASSNTNASQVTCLLLDSLIEDLLTCDEDGVFPWEIIQKEKEE